MSFRYPGIDQRFNVKFNIAWRLLEKGLWEHDEIDCIRKIVRDGDTVIDVGAWYGIYTILLSSLVGTNGCVISFEPDPKAREVLLENLGRNNISNVRVEKSCVTDSISKVTMTSLHLGDSSTSLVRFAGTAGDQVSSVEADGISLDEYCSFNKVQSNGIKVDAEGAEALIVKGMSGVIERFKPWLIVEFHGGFVQKEERAEKWETITRHAKKITFLQGDSKLFRYGDLMYSDGSDNDKGLPDCSHFTVLINF